MDESAGREGEGATIVETINAEGAGPVVLVCEHASNFIPPEFANLGLADDAFTSHIAWDPGAREVALDLSALLDAPLVAQRVSRLLYDCNRPPHAPDAIPARSEVYDVPGNVGLTKEGRAARVARFYRPFESTLSDCLDERAQRLGPPVLVTIHSFTPVYTGISREVEIGILHDRDSRLADLLLSSLETGSFYKVRRNEPYGPQHGVMHTLVTHAQPRGLHNVMIEIRNDLIAEREQQRRMAELLAEHLSLAVTAVRNTVGAQ